MPWTDFRRGDLMIQGSGHAVLWVGGSKPFVHNIDGGKFSGVIQQRSCSFGGDVFRCDDAEVADRASTFAENWAQTPGDDFQLPDPEPQKTVLKSPYSHQRMAGAFSKYGESTPWTVDSLFRAVKALARARDGAGLSPNRGVSCSQFATYCFQAAALAVHLGDVVPGQLIQAIRRDQPAPTRQTKETWRVANCSGVPAERLWMTSEFGAGGKAFRSLKDDGHLIRAAMNTHLARATEVMPSGLRTDAKFMHADKLKDAVSAPNSGFTRMGKAVLDVDGDGELRIKTG
ncbi:MAG: hypothetical protein ABW067_00080 [Rhizobacter sp.]|jgi:hypothetical protein